MAIFRPNNPGIKVEKPLPLMQAPKLREGKTTSGHKIGR